MHYHSMHEEEKGPREAATGISSVVYCCTYCCTFGWFVVACCSCACSSGKLSPRAINSRRSILRMRNYFWDSQWVCLSMSNTWHCLIRMCAVYTSRTNLLLVPQVWYTCCFSVENRAGVQIIWCNICTLPSSSGETFSQGTWL